MSEIQWLIPPQPGLFQRIAYRKTPLFIQKAYGPNRDLFKQMHNFRFVWRDYVITSYAGSISDLASGMHFVPRSIAARAQHNNWLDIGAHVHDLGHRGIAWFPDVAMGRDQLRLFDRVMFDLWQDKYERDPDVGWLRGWWQDGLPRRKYIVVRLASPFTWRPDYDNYNPDWMSIADSHRVEHAEVI